LLLFPQYLEDVIANSHTVKENVKERKKRLDTRITVTDVQAAGLLNFRRLQQLYVRIAVRLLDGQV